MADVLSQPSEPLPTSAHEWYWGNGRPCCVNCGALARCEHQYERNRVDTELRDYLARCRDALAMIASMPTTERNPERPLVPTDAMSSDRILYNRE